MAPGQHGMTTNKARDRGNIPGLVEPPGLSTVIPLPHRVYPVQRLRQYVVKKEERHGQDG